MYPHASTTSPFVDQADEASWYLWEKKTSILDLTHETQTDGRSFSGESSEDVTRIPAMSIPESPLQIQRKQYNAVLSRIDRASKHTGTYSSWST